MSKNHALFSLVIVALCLAITPVQAEAQEPTTRVEMPDKPSERPKKQQLRQEIRKDPAIPDQLRLKTDQPDREQTDRQPRKMPPTDQVDQRTDLQEEQRLQSKNVRAKLRGAEFSIDEESNTVTLTTPSGKTHELNHLPDQVVARLIERKTLSESDQLSELELRPTETGAEYFTTVARTKRLLGIIPRTVETEVVVDDATGAVTEQPLPAPRFFARLLNRLSF